MDARRRAQDLGITILGESVEALGDSGRQFGAITLIDVIEHLPRPVDALRTLTRALLPGGKLIVFTGATDSLSWRFAKALYWYSALPEHVAFFQPSWFRWAAPRLECLVSSVKRLSYQPSPLSTRIDEALKNVAYVIYHRMERRVFGRIVSRLPMIGRIGKWRSCWWTSARDHMLITLTKVTPTQISERGRLQRGARPRF